MLFQGFHDFLFKYYMEEGRRGKLLSSLIASHPQLGRLLNAEGNEYLSWLHHINTNNFWKVGIIRCFFTYVLYQQWHSVTLFYV